MNRSHKIFSKRTEWMHSGHMKTLRNTISYKQNMFKPQRGKDTEKKQSLQTKGTKFEGKQVIFKTLIVVHNHIKLILHHKLNEEPIFYIRMAYRAAVQVIKVLDFLTFLKSKEQAQCYFLIKLQSSKHNQDQVNF